MTFQPPKRRRWPLLVVVVGGLVAMWLASTAPRDQHVRYALGRSASDVTMFAVQYVAPDGDVAREVRMAFEPGRAPSIVPHEPFLANGSYRLRIDIDARDARRSTERQVTLSGGTTSVDVADVLAR